MISWQVTILVAKVIFAKLASGITQWLEKFSNGWIFCLQSKFGSWYTNFGQAGS